MPHTVNPEVPRTAEVNAPPEQAARSRPAAAGEPTGSFPGLRWSSEKGWSALSEQVAVEAPLAIEVAYERAGQTVRKVLAVTMRTPGDDEALALGFLFGEGLIVQRADVGGGEAATKNSQGENIPTWCVRLVRPPPHDLRQVSRGLITNSACGLCGRTTLEGLPLRARADAAGQVSVAPALVAALPDRLRQQQKIFDRTGGVHGAALFDPTGNLLLVREDVGRHNAVDKLFGTALRSNLATTGLVLVLSGRVSFELMQKAVVAGVAVVVAVGAPSSLAIELAQASGITLAGFVRDGRFNTYTHAGRLGSPDRVPPAVVS